MLAYPPAATAASASSASLPAPPPSSGAQSLLREALTQESARVLQETTRVLKKKLCIDAPIRSFRHGRPTPLAQLKVRIEYGPGAYGGSRRSSKVTSKQRMVWILSALGKLIRHSYLLNACPQLKVVFWQDVLDSRMMHEEWSEETPRCIHPSFFEAPRFPSATIELVGLEIDSEWANALVWFLTREPRTTRPNLDQHLGVHVPKQIPVGLRFTTNYLPVSDVILIKDVLDRSSGRGASLFRVDALDLSEVSLGTAHVHHLTEIVSRNPLYGLRGVSVGDCAGFADQTPGYADANRALLQAAFATPNSPARQTSLPRAIRGGSSLKLLRICRTPLGVQHIAAICSSLRYGCTMEELSLNYVLGYKVDPAIREECWRWLAFGLFYPRSKRLGGAFKLRTLDLSLADIPMAPADAKAFKSTLLNPALHLARFLPAKNNRAEEFIFCVLQSGSSIFASRDFKQRRCMVVLEEETELEALCVEEHSVCVVVPGYGLGWVQADQVVCITRESLDEKAANATYDLELDIYNESKNTPNGIGAFLGVVGERIGSLHLQADCSKVVRSLLPSVFRYCVNLKHLSMSCVNLRDDDLSDLFRALHGELGARLLSLRLDDSKIGDATIDRVAEFLSNKTRVPALEKLSVIVDPPQRASLVYLYEALAINKTLHTLELLQPRELMSDSIYYGRGRYTEESDDESDSFDSEDYVDAIEERDDLDRKFQNEILRAGPLPQRCKAAFVSVITHSNSIGKARGGLDSWILAQIFQFISMEVRRQIIWKENLVPFEEDDPFDKGW